MASIVTAIAFIAGRHGDDRWRSNDNSPGHRHAHPISMQVSFANLRPKADDTHGVDRAFSLQVALCAVGERSFPHPQGESSASDATTNTAAGPFAVGGAAAGVSAGATTVETS
mmetsp:Transcript_74254/g.159179  ORF Transcript_74254/g.159179 Transcript_74254/m.159179 type:complete len:113 (-) Transcript_74254:1507-1845(-)